MGGRGKGEEEGGRDAEQMLQIALIQKSQQHFMEARR